MLTMTVQGNKDNRLITCASHGSFKMHGEEGTISISRFNFNEVLIATPTTIYCMRKDEFRKALREQSLIIIQEDESI